MIQAAGLGVAYHAKPAVAAAAPRGSIMAISPRCSMRRGTGGTSLWRLSLSVVSACGTPGLAGIGTGACAVHHSRMVMAGTLRWPAVLDWTATTARSAPRTAARRRRWRPAAGRISCRPSSARRRASGRRRRGDRLLRHLDDHLAGAEPLLGGVRRCASTLVMTTPLTLSLIL